MLTTDGGFLNCWRQAVRKRGFTQDGKILCRKWYNWLEDMKKQMSFLGKVGRCGRWPQQACTTTFFLIRRNVTREADCAYADVDTLAGNCEGS